MSSAFMTAMGVGFSLGFIHALDADHVMAMTSLNNKRPKLTTMLMFCVHWALGHAAVLLLGGLLLFGLDIKMPAFLQYAAEMGVGLILIFIGVLCFWTLRTDKHSLNTTNNKQVPAFVGIIHGLAGSAPVLALIPLTAQENIYLSMSYLLIFSFGIMFSMLLFGFGFGSFQTLLQHKTKRFFIFQRYLIAGASVSLGSFWVAQVI